MTFFLPGRFFKVNWPGKIQGCLFFFLNDKKKIVRKVLMKREHGAQKANDEN